MTLGKLLHVSELSGSSTIKWEWPLQVALGIKGADACEMRGARPGPWWARPIYISNFVPVPYCFDDYSFVI